MAEIKNYTLNFGYGSVQTLQFAIANRPSSTGVLTLVRNFFVKKLACADVQCTLAGPQRSVAWQR